ncbi:hypothetical protein HYFRA_00002297 [Hymenoscyphus fraxineus]|uniref:Uncharacterized protein n=1 Tax=Hymenoscyphus fraxineus TaxID=746836 RepID=A0A9N9L5K0_9HELO|nr:hypothetical protein HYFRA_00002297 [Hymenoscyphus fraxineus]
MSSQGFPPSGASQAAEEDPLWLPPREWEEAEQNWKEGKQVLQQGFRELGVPGLGGNDFRRQEQPTQFSSSHQSQYVNYGRPQNWPTQTPSYSGGSTPQSQSLSTYGNLSPPHGQMNITQNTLPRQTSPFGAHSEMGHYGNLSPPPILRPGPQNPSQAPNYSNYPPPSNTNPPYDSISSEARTDMMDQVLGAPLAFLGRRRSSTSSISSDGSLSKKQSALHFLNQKAQEEHNMLSGYPEYVPSVHEMPYIPQRQQKDVLMGNESQRYGTSASHLQPSQKQQTQSSRTQYSQQEGGIKYDNLQQGNLQQNHTQQQSGAAPQLGYGPVQPGIPYQPLQQQLQPRTGQASAPLAIQQLANTNEQAQQYSAQYINLSMPPPGKNISNYGPLRAEMPYNSAIPPRSQYGEGQPQSQGMPNMAPGQQRDQFPGSTTNLQPPQPTGQYDYGPVQMGMSYNALQTQQQAQISSGGQLHSTPNRTQLQVAQRQNGGTPQEGETIQGQMSAFAPPPGQQPSQRAGQQANYGPVQAGISPQLQQQQHQIQGVQNHEQHDNTGLGQALSGLAGAATDYLQSQTSQSGREPSSKYSNELQAQILQQQGAQQAFQPSGGQGALGMQGITHGGLQRRGAIYQHGITQEQAAHQQQSASENNQQSQSRMPVFTQQQSQMQPGPGNRQPEQSLPVHQQPGESGQSYRPTQMPQYGNQAQPAPTREQSQNQMKGFPQVSHQGSGNHQQQPNAAALKQLPPPQTAAASNQVPTAKQMQPQNLPIIPKPTPAPKAVLLPKEPHTAKQAPRSEGPAAPKMPDAPKQSPAQKQGPPPKAAPISKMNQAKQAPETKSAPLPKETTPPKMSPAKQSPLPKTEVPKSVPPVVVPKPAKETLARKTQVMAQQKQQSSPRNMGTSPQKPDQVPKEHEQKSLEANTMPKPGHDSKLRDDHSPPHEKEKGDRYPSAMEAQHGQKFPSAQKQKQEDTSHHPESQDKGMKPKHPHILTGGARKEGHVSDEEVIRGEEHPESIFSSGMHSKHEFMAQSHSEPYHSEWNAETRNEREEDRSAQNKSSDTESEEDEDEVSLQLSDEDHSDRGKLSDREISDGEISEADIEQPQSKSQSHESQAQKEHPNQHTENTNSNTSATYISIFKQSSTYVERLYHSDGSQKNHNEIRKFREECTIDDNDRGPEPAMTWFEESPELRVEAVESVSESGDGYELEDFEGDDWDGSLPEVVEGEEEISVMDGVEYVEEDERGCLVDGDVAPFPVMLWFGRLRGQQDVEVSDEEEERLSVNEEGEGSQEEVLDDTVNGEEDETPYDEKDEQDCMIEEDLAPCPAEYWFKRLRGISSDSDRDDTAERGVVVESSHEDAVLHDEEGDEEEARSDYEDSLQGNFEHNEDDENDHIVEMDLAPNPAKLWFEKVKGSQGIGSEGEVSDEEGVDEVDLSEEEVNITTKCQPFHVLSKSNLAFQEIEDDIDAQEVRLRLVIILRVIQEANIEQQDSDGDGIKTEAEETDGEEIEYGDEEEVEELEPSVDGSDNNLDEDEMSEEGTENDEDEGLEGSEAALSEMEEENEDSEAILSGEELDGEQSEDEMHDLQSENEDGDQESGIELGTEGHVSTTEEDDEFHRLGKNGSDARESELTSGLLDVEKDDGKDDIKPIHVISGASLVHQDKKDDLKQFSTIEHDKFDVEGDLLPSPQGSEKEDITHMEKSYPELPRNRKEDPSTELSAEKEEGASSNNPSITNDRMEAIGEDSQGRFQEGESPSRERSGQYVTQENVEVEQNHHSEATKSVNAHETPVSEKTREDDNQDSRHEAESENDAEEVDELDSENDDQEEVSQCEQSDDLESEVDKSEVQSDEEAGDGEDSGDEIIQSDEDEAISNEEDNGTVLDTDEEVEQTEDEEEEEDPEEVLDDMAEAYENTEAQSQTGSEVDLETEGEDEEEEEDEETAEEDEGIESMIGDDINSGEDDEKSDEVLESDEEEISEDGEDQQTDLDNIQEDELVTEDEDEDDDSQLDSISEDEAEPLEEDHKLNTNPKNTKVPKSSPQKLKVTTNDPKDSNEKLNSPAITDDEAEDADSEEEPKMKARVLRRWKAFARNSKAKSRKSREKKKGLTNEFMGSEVHGEEEDEDDDNEDEDHDDNEDNNKDEEQESEQELATAEELITEDEEPVTATFPSDLYPTHEEEVLRQKELEDGDEFKSSLITAVDN